MISLVGSRLLLSCSVEGGGGDPDSGIDFENLDTRDIRRVSREKRWTMTRDTACQPLLCFCILMSREGNRGRLTAELLFNRMFLVRRSTSFKPDHQPHSISLLWEGAHHQDSHLSLIREGSCPVVKHPDHQPSHKLEWGHTESFVNCQNLQHQSSWRHCYPFSQLPGFGDFEHLSGSSTANC
jgi:hypothetical protein